MVVTKPDVKEEEQKEDVDYYDEDEEDVIGPKRMNPFLSVCLI